MTGYGRGVAEFGQRRIVVEMKSVNHRFIDIKMRGASVDPSVEEQITKLIRKRLERGAVTVSLRFEGAAGAASVRPDPVAARRVHRELTDLAQELGIVQQVGLELVCAQPGVMVPRESDDEQDGLAAAAVEAAESALVKLAEMRHAEGQTLARDISQRLDRLRELGDQVQGMAASAPEAAMRRLRERLNRLLEDSAIVADEARLAQEVAALADRQEITEELVRLRSHLDQFSKLMDGDGAVGRRLDFLVQELGREVNTIGSKSQLAEIAALVVEAKAELEKVREQVQNLE